MTGPEHYLEAERLIDTVIEQDMLAAEIAARMTVAQVHATLALAAATAFSRFSELPGRDCEAWLKAASGEPWRAQ